MKTLLTACAGLFACACLTAQGSMTTPPGGLPGEGAGYSSYPMGMWPEMRIHQADDMHSDGKAKAITEVAFRMDYRSHTSSSTTGRSWTNITVEMSEPASYNTMGNNFAANVGTSPTRVFDSKWTWPTYSGFPLLQPDVWGGAKGQVRFPFEKPWIYTAKGSILADYTFRGGTLANNVAWSANSMAFFFLDSESINYFATYGSLQQIPSVRPECSDSAFKGVTGGAYTYGYAVAYGRDHPTVKPRGRPGLLGFYHYSTLTAPDAPVIHALGTGGKPNGVNIGAGCNSLYVDFTKPAILASFKTLSLHTYSYTGSLSWALDWQEEFAGMDLWLQGAWTDSTTKRFKLTSAVNLTFPTNLPPDAPRYKTVYQLDLEQA